MVPLLQLKVSYPLDAHRGMASKIKDLKTNIQDCTIILDLDILQHTGFFVLNLN